MTTTTSGGEPAGEQRRRAIPSSLHVLDSLQPGGAQAVAIDLARWLTAQGARAAIAGPPGPLADALPAGVDFEPLRPGLPPAVQLLRVVGRTRPGVLHAHQRADALRSAAVGRLLGIPVVEHAHTVLPRTSLRALSFRSPVVFSVGPNVTRMIVEEFGRGADRVLTLGNVPAHRGDTPATVRTPETDAPLRLVGIGRLVAQKDPLRFVRVVAAIARSRRVEARWLGQGPLLDEARALAAGLGAPVRFLGLADDVVGALDESHALLLPSRWEGNPLVALEAFARRRPVFATEAAGLDLGEASRRLLVVPDDASDDAFARAVLAGVADEDALAAVVEAEHAHVERDLVPDRVFGPVAEVYRRLAGSRPRAGGAV